MNRNIGYLIMLVILTAVAGGCGGHGASLSAGKKSKYLAMLNKAFGHRPAVAAKKAQRKSYVLPKAAGRAPITQGSVYYDDNYQIWVRVDQYVTETDPDSGAVFVRQHDYAFFQDQALTTSVGRDYHFVYTQNGKNVDEQGFDVTYGPGAGNHYYGKLATDPATKDNETWDEYRFPGSDYLTKGHGTWVESTRTRSGRLELRMDNGTYDIYDFVDKDSGESSMQYSNETPYSVTLNWVPDGSGTFTLVAPATPEDPGDPMLPANGSWAPSGQGSVTFADGSTQSFTYGDTGFTF